MLYIRSSKAIMIISHKHKFMFIKTKKTAGTSFEIALSKYCGSEDIITPISAEDELIRKDLNYKGPQNYKTDTVEYYSHINAQDIKSSIGDEIWNSYYKFCFERNIYEKIISFYYWEYKTEPRPNIKEFILSDRINRLLIGDNCNYKINSKVAVDDIYQYEFLQESFKNILNKLSIKDDKAFLPQAKTKYRKNKSSYKEILTTKEIALIDKLILT